MILGTSAVVIDENSKPLEYRDLHDVNSLSEARDAHIICHSSAMIRMKVFEKEGKYDVLFKNSEDYELFLRLLKRGYKIRNLRDYLLYQRKHMSRVSVTKRAEQILFACLANEIHVLNTISRDSIRENIKPDEIYQMLSDKSKYSFHLKNAGAFKNTGAIFKMVLEFVPSTYYFLKIHLGF